MGSVTLLMSGPKMPVRTGALQQCGLLLDWKAAPAGDDAEILEGMAAG